MNLKRKRKTFKNKNKWNTKMNRNQEKHCNRSKIDS